MRLRTIAGTAAAAAALAAAAGCGEPAAPDTAAPPAPPASSVPAATGTPAAPTGTAPRVVRVAVTVSGGEPRVPHHRVRVPRGAIVEITVTGDTAEEFHLHGYDRELTITPGRPAVLRFTADTPGVFEAELHRSGTRVLELRVG
ncbi:hypothetical protein [Actinomadura geliboluensis]|uniref:hypothetical protein n=1 Tax=Actinomadura geliboluensis TaxID=882440 RepID=UPI00371C3FE9